MYNCDCDHTVDKEDYPMRLMVSAHIDVYLDRQGKVEGVSVKGSNQGDLHPYPFYLECSECGAAQGDDKYPDLPYKAMAAVIQLALMKMLGV